MKCKAFALVVMAAAFSVASAYSFPYVQCQKSSSAYTLDPVARTPDLSTFCFTVRVNVPDNCNDSCCNEADLRKILIDINPECNVNPSLSATINGVPTAVGPGLEPGVDGPEDAYVLRLTQLGLNLTNADGAEICVTLGPNSSGEGCLTMGAFCRPPWGAPAGTCAAALFDSSYDCCPVAPISAYLAPPPPPPQLPPPPTINISYPDACTVCATLAMQPGTEVWYDVSFDQDQCDNWASTVVEDVKRNAEYTGAQLVDEPPVITCSDKSMQVCGRFETEEDAALLAPFINSMLYMWYANAVDTCKAYYQSPFTPIGSVDNGIDGTGCLTAQASVSCDAPPLLDWPKCKCRTSRGITPFFASPFLEVKPGRYPGTQYYCFELTVQSPYLPDSPCGQTTTLLKAEVYANDSYRRKLHGLSITPPGGQPYRVAPSWGPLGDNTLKFSALNWNSTQADGASLCFELEKDVILRDFCFGAVCRIIFFDPSKDCCPMFLAST